MTSTHPCPPAADDVEITAAHVADPANLNALLYDIGRFMADFYQRPNLVMAGVHAGDGAVLVNFLYSWGITKPG